MPPGYPPGFASGYGSPPKQASTVDESRMMMQHLHMSPGSGIPYGSPFRPSVSTYQIPQYQGVAHFRESMPFSDVGSQLPAQPRNHFQTTMIPDLPMYTNLDIPGHIDSQLH